ncbi:substrate-binding domain-containing protein [Streptomyces sp. NPDC002920]
MTTRVPLAAPRRAVRPAGTLQPIVTADFTVNQGRRAAEPLLAAPGHPTAVFCANDLLALGSGLRIPDDLALVGHNDIAAAQTVGIPLTSPRVDGHATGLLLDEERDPRHEHRRILFAPRLVERASS